MEVGSSEGKKRKKETLAFRREANFSLHVNPLLNKNELLLSLKVNLFTTIYNSMVYRYCSILGPQFYRPIG